MRKVILLFAAAFGGSCSIASSAATFMHHTATGVRASYRGSTIRVDALRSDVLRVRMYRDTRIGEDASWAVLPLARTSSVPVRATPTGFATAEVDVSIDATLCLTVRDSSGHVLQQDSAPVEWRENGFRVAKKMLPTDHFFGLGDKGGSLDRVGQSFVMWNTDSYGFQESTDPLYKSVPFFLRMQHGGAIGVLLDNTFRSFFDFGHQTDSEYSFSAPDGPLDYYLIVGPEPKKVVSGYAWLTGATPLPPMWALGFQQSRYSYTPQTQVEEIAARLRHDQIPVDAIYLDIDYQNKNRPFTIDKRAFPDFAGMIRTLQSENIHTVAITDLHIAHLPGEGYLPYDGGKAGDHFVKSSDGKDYIGQVWPGPSVFPDFLQRKTRAWWGTLYREFIQQGVAGFWNDMNEPAIFSYPNKTMPNDVRHRIEEPGFKTRTATHLEAHNIFGMENSRATYEGLLALSPNVRPFVLTRASYAGGQRYAATWTGDNSSTWNHLRLATSQLINLGLSGFALSGADVGGFTGSPSPDLLTRWTELGAFQPIYRNHASKGTRPHEVWSDGPVHEEIRKRYIEERYRLMPYLYTLAEEMSRNGLPIVRPLFMEFPDATDDGAPADLYAPNEFLFGASILVSPAPSPDEIAPYEVHLPLGTWYDYWTGLRVERTQLIKGRDPEIRDTGNSQAPIMVSPSLADLPVYVRGGTILPMAPLTQSTSELPEGPLTLKVFPGEHCNGDVFLDDGKSFEYRSGKFFRMYATCSIDESGRFQLHIGKPEGAFQPWFHELKIVVVGWHPKEQRTIGKPDAMGWAVTVPFTRSEQTIELH
ncbi:MAG: glycoside hydrolase family 31 [Acidobacteriaceae bacterium]|nr:glycoside hydrolase family 31 [Acidobacteriaceae bacterium]